MDVSLVVNGCGVGSEGDASMTLLLFLRNELGLKAARFGCGNENCGACTVRVDGELRYACGTTLEDVAGRRVETLEGLDDELARTLRDELVAAAAGQCGYCLSGIFMTAYTTIEQRPGATDDELKAALSRNLCRCGAHPRILRAVRATAACRRSGDGHADRG